MKSSTCLICLKLSSQSNQVETIRVLAALPSDNEDWTRDRSSTSEVAYEGVGFTAGLQASGYTVRSMSRVINQQNSFRGSHKLNLPQQPEPGTEKCSQFIFLSIRIVQFRFVLIANCPLIIPEMYFPLSIRTYFRIKKSKLHFLHQAMISFWMYVKMILTAGRTNSLRNVSGIINRNYWKEQTDHVS